LCAIRSLVRYAILKNGGAIVKTLSGCHPLPGLVGGRPNHAKPAPIAAVALAIAPHPNPRTASIRGACMRLRRVLPRSGCLILKARRTNEGSNLAWPALRQMATTGPGSASCRAFKAFRAVAERAQDPDLLEYPCALAPAKRELRN